MALLRKWGFHCPAGWRSWVSEVIRRDQADDEKWLTEEACRAVE
jgi:hypothetical protein